ncbi:uroporphyrinogen-III C-methyltransferase [Elstera litoralis]|uniref:uroporphyrinogen-III C-methyltransferase n=1 Tax=Elstera litoralis TaxID=552518 RepID=UPI000A74E389
MVDAPDFTPGSVWLVGAGPGDPGLLTLHALHALKSADVIVYDALVSPGILALIPPTTARDYAGKRGGKPSPQQADITQRLIALAAEGKKIVRLKGGDPFVFGRGGEEAKAWRRRGCRFGLSPALPQALQVSPMPEFRRRRATRIKRLSSLPAIWPPRPMGGWIGRP